MAAEVLQLCGMKPLRLGGEATVDFLIHGARNGTDGAAENLHGSAVALLLLFLCLLLAIRHHQTDTCQIPGDQIIFYWWKLFQASGLFWHAKILIYGCVFIQVLVFFWVWGLCCLTGGSSGAGSERPATTTTPRMETWCGSGSTVRRLSSWAGEYWHFITSHDQAHLWPSHLSSQVLCCVSRVEEISVHLTLRQ